MKIDVGEDGNEYELENAHRALLYGGGTTRERAGRRAERSRDLANADVQLGYSHAATGAYEGARKSKQREVTGSHGGDDGKSRRRCRFRGASLVVGAWRPSRSRTARCAGTTSWTAPPHRCGTRSRSTPRGGCGRSPTSRASAAPSAA